MERDFYISLPSNASMDRYPHNAIHHYKVKLPIPLTLERRKWEVAVSELYVPVSWHNIRPPFNWFQLEMEMRKTITIHHKDGTVEQKITEEVVKHNPVTIQAGVYSSVDLIQTLNQGMKQIIEEGIQQGHYDEMQENGDRIVTKRDYPRGLLEFHLKEDGHVVFVAASHHYKTWVSLPEELIQFLGFTQIAIESIYKRDLHPIPEKKIRVGMLDNLMREKKERDEQNRIHHRNFSEMTSRDPACHQCGFDVLHVYSPLVEDRVLGDTMGPLLSQVPVSHHMLQDSMVHQSPQNREYLGLRHSTFDHIEIYIMDDAGQKVPFLYGKAIVTLHFRPRYG